MEMAAPSWGGCRNLGWVVIIANDLRAKRADFFWNHTPLMNHTHFKLKFTHACTSQETGPPPSGQLNAGVRRREGLARRPYRARTRAEILARVSIRLVVNKRDVLGINKLSGYASVYVCTCARGVTVEDSWNHSRQCRPFSADHRIPTHPQGGAERSYLQVC